MRHVKGLRQNLFQSEFSTEDLDYEFKEWAEPLRQGNPLLCCHLMYLFRKTPMYVMMKIYHLLPSHGHLGDNTRVFVKK